MNDRFLRACRGEKLDRPPIWIMRQAGRYLPEYRAIRKEMDFVTLCKTPEKAAEVTIQPIDRLGVDAAILFSDILVPVEPMGFNISFNPGPVLDHAVRTMQDVDNIRITDPEETVPYVYEAIRILRRELEGRVPLIGFAAAPFTLATYMVEGQGSKNFSKVKGLLFSEPATAHALLEKLTVATEKYLLAQIRAGAQAVQLFDSWAGLLSAEDFREFGMPYARRILDTLKDAGVPRIYFALNNAHLLDEIKDCGADVVGMDWRMNLAEANQRLDGRYPLQGNLDPTVLLSGSPETIRERARRVVAAGKELPGHIFNLGHGILPETPVEHAQALVQAVQEVTS